jgi:hypothetical protein
MTTLPLNDVCPIPTLSTRVSLRKQIPVLGLDLLLQSATASVRMLLNGMMHTPVPE